MYPSSFPIRLKEAREARGLTLSQLALKVGRTRQAIAQFESGQANPAPDVYLSLTKALNVPASFFSAEPLYADLNPIFYRKLKSARDRDLTMVERRLSWLQHTIACMERFVEFPSVALPESISKSDPNDISVTEIEEMATAVRQAW